MIYALVIEAVVIVVLCALLWREGQRLERIIGGDAEERRELLNRIASPHMIVTPPSRPPAPPKDLVVPDEFERVGRVYFAADDEAS
jgi:hypothetical protein